MSDEEKSEEELRLELSLLRRRLAVLECAEGAFAPWPAPSLPRGRPTAVPHRELVRRIDQRRKRNVRTLTEIPPEEVSVSGVRTRLERPKSLDARHASAPWYAQLETAFLLHLRDGFFGDNAVFDDGRYFGLDRWWLTAPPLVYSGVDEVRRIDAGISIAAWGGEAFQHFVCDALPRLAAVLDLLETPELRHVRIVSHWERAPAARWFWNELGLAERVEQKPRNARVGFVIHANHVLYLDFEPSLGVGSVYPRGVLAPVQRRLGVLDPVPRDRVLYLARPGLPRGVADESRLLARIERALAGSPLRLEVFRHRTLAEDRDVVRRARAIVGPHGGAFGNLVFAQPGTLVVEFLPIYDTIGRGNDSRPMYWGLAQAAGLEYWTVTPKRFGYEDPDIAVDPDEVAAVLQTALAADGVRP